MKFSAPFIAAIMAATANTFADADPSSPKGESVGAKSSKANGKSGKASNGFASVEDFGWLEGNYTECIQTGTALFDGSPYTTFENDCENHNYRLEITRLQLDGGGDSHSFRAYYYYDVVFGEEVQMFRWTSYGTGSLDPNQTNHITLYNEYVDVSTDGGITWAEDLEDHHLGSDANTMKLTLSDDGKYIFADYYANTVISAHHTEEFVSKAWVVGE